MCDKENDGINCDTCFEFVPIKKIHVDKYENTVCEKCRDKEENILLSN